MSTTADEPGAKSPFTMTVEVAWGDMDALGHVNHVAYLRFVETVRAHYFALMGAQAVAEREGVGPVVVRVEASYRAPTRFPDRIRVSNRAIALGRSSIRFENRLVSTRDDATLVEAQVVVCFVDRQGAVVPIPEPVRAAIDGFDGPAVGSDLG